MLKIFFRQLKNDIINHTSNADHRVPITQSSYFRYKKFSTDEKVNEMRITQSMIGVKTPRAPTTSTWQVNYSKKNISISQTQQWELRTHASDVHEVQGACGMPFVSSCSTVRHNNLRRSYAFPSQIGHGYELRRSRDAIRVHIIRKNSEDVISNFRARSRDFVTRKLDFF